MSEGKEQCEHDESVVQRVLTELELLNMLTDPGDIEAARDPRPVEQHDTPYSAADLD